MENTHITKKNPTYIEIKQSCFIYLCNRICECHPKSGTRLALDISLYVIDNSLIGNKQQLLISGRKKIIAAKIFQDWCQTQDWLPLYSNENATVFMILYNRTHKTDKTGEEYTQLLLSLHQDLSIVMQEL